MAAKKKGGAGAGRTGEMLPGEGGPLRPTVVYPSGSLKDFHTVRCFLVYVSQ